MKQYGFYFDSTRCSGCRTCELTCVLSHEQLINPQLARNKVETDVQQAYLTDVLYCQQCDDARCLAACPLPIDEEVPVIADFRPREELMNLSAGQILNMTDAELEAFTAGTALRRPGKDALRRNARLNLDAK